MHSWSDSFLNSVNHWANIAGILGAMLVAVSVILIYFSADEISSRSDEKLRDAKQEAQEANLLAKSLEEKQRPKSITEKQKQEFINALNNAPKGVVTVCSVTMDNKSANYANQIRSMLDDAGYKDPKHPKSFIMSGAVTTSVDTNVVIVTRTKDKAPNYMWAIQNAFDAIGIKAPGIIPNPPNELVNDGDVIIVITSG